MLTTSPRRRETSSTPFSSRAPLSDVIGRATRPRLVASVSVSASSDTSASMETSRPSRRLEIIARTTLAGSLISRVLQIVAHDAVELLVAQCRLLSGALLVAPHEVRQTLGRERLARDAEDGDGALDVLRAPLYLDQIVHARIPLEAYRGTGDFVLRDLAINDTRDDQADPLEDLRHDVRLGHSGLDLLAYLVPAGIRRGPLPPQFRPRRRAGAIDPESHDLLTPRELARRRIQPPILQVAREHERAPGVPHTPATTVPVVHDGLQLHLTHDRCSP